MAAEPTGDAVGRISPQDAPSRTDGSGAFKLATWNIRSGRNGGLESALRALDALEVDIALLTETKLTKGIYTRWSSSYSVIATDAKSAYQGGVALCIRKGELFEVEEAIVRGPNVISFQLVTGQARYYAVGAYIPPSDLQTLEQVKDA